MTRSARLKNIIVGVLAEADTPLGLKSIYARIRPNHPYALASLGGALYELRAEGRIVAIGRGRGTRYATPAIVSAAQADPPTIVEAAASMRFVPIAATDALAPTANAAPPSEDAAALADVLSLGAPNLTALPRWVQLLALQIATDIYATIGERVERAMGERDAALDLAAEAEARYNQLRSALLDQLAQHAPPTS